MHYYIDGYNLMFRVVRAGDDLQSQRIKIIKDLNAKVHLLQIEATIVFDAQYQLGETSRTHFKDLEIFFTAEGETADEYILRHIKGVSHPENCTVVTSDKRLAWAVRRRLAKTESVEEFLGWLNKRFFNKIRHLKEKEELKPPKALHLPKKPVKRKKEIKEDPEDRLHYYLKIFEEKMGELKVEEPKKRLSDYERWLKAFEEGENQQEP